MSARPIDFYFEFASPYGYLASVRIGRLAANYGREVAWHPIMLGAAFKLTGAKPLLHIPLKGPYVIHDITRMARLWQVPFTMPPLDTLPINSLAASRATVWLDQHDPTGAIALAKAIYHAHWGEGRHLGTVEAVADVAADQGIDRQLLSEAVADPLIKVALKYRTEEAIKRGVFGSPFIFVDDEPFWGADRLEQVDLWLQHGGW
jgi:2-hydroxychromene-2-carboxylate isomerase